MAKEQSQSLVDILATAAAGGGKQLLSPQEMIQNLQGQGYQIIKKDPLRQTLPYKIDATWAERAKGIKTLRFGVVSDTHLGSQKQQLTFLNQFYDKCEGLGIKDIFHGGDLFDGDGSVYRGQQYDLFKFGADAQLDYGIVNYPHRKGITTHVVAGNHDWSFWKRGGFDILSRLSGARPDIKYLGSTAAVVIYGGLKIQVTHGSGGGTYARSYRLQRLIENFTPENKPEIFLLGNFHNWAQVPMVRNVNGWQLGCFQAQTDFEKSKGLFPEIGGLIIEIDVNDLTKRGERPIGQIAFRQEIVPFYVPKSHDW